MRLRDLVNDPQWATVVAHVVAVALEAEVSASAGTPAKASATMSGRMSLAIRGAVVMMSSFRTP